MIYDMFFLTTLTVTQLTLRQVTAFGHQDFLVRPKPGPPFSSPRASAMARWGDGPMVCDLT